MACYTISECVLEHLSEAKKYTTELLLTFTQENEHRIAIDDKDLIKKKYTSVAEKMTDTDIKNGILYWLYLMKDKPPKWEYIDVEDEDNPDIFLEVCSNTVDKKLIVSSENRCIWRTGISAERIYKHKDIEIKILNRDEAITELKPAVVIKSINENKNINENHNK